MPDPSQSLILSLDQGTTSSRAILFDANGQAVASAQKEFRQIYPKPGWVEHDPSEIWSTQLATARDVLARVDPKRQSVRAVGITNQRETALVWDRESGAPIHNAIVWQDRRTAAACAKLKSEGLEPMIRERTGLCLDPYFSATKIQWILENVEGARAAANEGRLCFGTVDSWLLWNLTGGRTHATDATNASRTMLMNLETGAWDQDLLNYFGIPMAMLPEVRGSSEIYDHTDVSLLGQELPVAGIAGDQQAALFGQACFEEGMAKNTYGTGCFLLMNAGKEPPRSENQLLSTIAWRINGETEYALEGSVFVAGAAVQWLRDELKLVADVDELNALARSVDDSGGVVLVPAFTGLGAPHWDPHARGTLVGMTRGTNRAHLCRATLESIALQSADLIECMQRDTGLRLSELRVDGGASRSDLLMQIQSDLLETDVVRPSCVETTALGAAYLAGLATGVWNDRSEIAKQWQEDRRFCAQGDPEAISKLRSDWLRAVERAKAWEA